jgi:hypothetical protein
MGVAGCDGATQCFRYIGYVYHTGDMNGVIAEEIRDNRECEFHGGKLGP